MVLKKSVLIMFVFLFLILISFSVSSQRSPIKQVNHFGTFCELAECDGSTERGYLDVLNPRTCEYDLRNCVSNKAKLEPGDFYDGRLTRGADCFYDNDCPSLGCIGVGHKTMEIPFVRCESKYPIIRSLVLREPAYDSPGICTYGFSGKYCDDSRPLCVMDTDCPSLSCSNSFLDGFFNQSTGRWVSAPPKKANGICSRGECSYNPDRDCSRKVECTPQTFSRDCAGTIMSCTANSSKLAGKCFVPYRESKGYCQQDSRQCGVVGTPMQGVSPTIPGTPMTTGTPPTTFPVGIVPSGTSCQVVTNNPNVDMNDYEPNKEFDNNPSGGVWEYNYAGPSGAKVSSASEIDTTKEILYLVPEKWNEQFNSFWTQPREAVVSVCEGDKLLYPVDKVMYLGGYNEFKSGTENYKFLTYSRYCALNQNDADCKDTCSSDNKIGFRMEFLKRIESMCLQGPKPDLTLEPGTGQTLQDGCGAYWLLTDITKDPVDFLKDRTGVIGYNCDRQRYGNNKGVCYTSSTSSGIVPQHISQLSQTPLPNDLVFLDPKTFSQVFQWPYGTQGASIPSAHCVDSGFPAASPTPPGTSPSGYCCNVKSLTCAPQCPENYVISPTTGECVHKSLITGEAIRSVSLDDVPGNCRMNPNPSPEIVNKFKENMASAFVKYVGAENIQSFMSAISVSFDGAININYPGSVNGLTDKGATAMVTEAASDAERMDIFASLNWLRIFSFYPSVGQPYFFEWSVTLTVPGYENPFFSIITDALTASPASILINTFGKERSSYMIGTFYETASDDDKSSFDVSCGNDGSTTFTYTSFSSGNLVVTNKYGQTVATGKASFRSPLSITLLSDAIPFGEFFVTFTGDNGKTDTSSQETPCKGVTITSNDPQDPPTNPPTDPPTGVTVNYGGNENRENFVYGVSIALTPAGNGDVSVSLSNNGETSFVTDARFAGAIVNFANSGAMDKWSENTFLAFVMLLEKELTNVAQMLTTDPYAFMAAGDAMELEMGTDATASRISADTFELSVSIPTASPTNPVAIALKTDDDAISINPVLMTGPEQIFTITNPAIGRTYGLSSFSVEATAYILHENNPLESALSFIETLITNFYAKLVKMGQQAEQETQYMQGMYAQPNPQSMSQPSVLTPTFS